MKLGALAVVRYRHLRHVMDSNVRLYKQTIEQRRVISTLVHDERVATDTAIKLMEANRDLRRQHHKDIRIMIADQAMLTQHYEILYTAAKDAMKPHDGDHGALAAAISRLKDVLDKMVMSPPQVRQDIPNGSPVSDTVSRTAWEMAVAASKDVMHPATPDYDPDGGMVGPEAYGKVAAPGRSAPGSGDAMNSRSEEP